jgi:Ca2+-binding RTX toxin-like protein
MLTVTATVNAQGRLDISSDGSDSIDITVQDGNVKVNGADPSSGPVSPAGVMGINVQGGPGANDIDLSDVDSSNGFTGLNGKITIDGNAGNDTIRGSGFSDDINGRTGTDVIFGGPGADSVQGGSGNDPDTLNGDAGNDSILGAGGLDVVNGGADDDTLFGGTGGTQLNGDSGNNLFVIEKNGATHIVNGGTGDDTIKYQGTDGDDSVTLQGMAGSDVLMDNAGTTVTGNDVPDWVMFLLRGGDLVDLGTDFASIQNISVIGGEGNDTIDGSAQTTPPFAW